MIFVITICHLFNFQLKRQVCFENTSENLKKWNPIVTKNRVADHLVFPINTSSSKKLSDNRKVKSYRIQSDLEKEYASLEPSEEAEDNENQIDKFTLTKEEMIQKAKENAKFRAQQVSFFFFFIELYVFCLTHCKNINYS